MKQTHFKASYQQIMALEQQKCDLVQNIETLYSELRVSLNQSELYQGLFCAIKQSFVKELDQHIIALES
jgi:hypothetical protein